MFMGKYPCRLPEGPMLEFPTHYSDDGVRWLVGLLPRIGAIVA